jgi:uncharacterized OsmC-like protein
MLYISAISENRKGENKIKLKTNNQSKQIDVASNINGFGSKVNGGEYLMLAVATCYSNDIYREAKKRHIKVNSVEVEANAEAEAIPGAPAHKITYRAKVNADASEEEILALMRHTDSVAEIHNTLRASVEVEMGEFEAESSR